MASTDGLSGDARDQIARLRDQVDALMRDRVTPALADASDRAQRYYGDASETAREQAEALGDRVKEQPLVAILVAGAVGYLIGRIVR